MTITSTYKVSDIFDSNLMLNVERDEMISKQEKVAGRKITTLYYPSDLIKQQMSSTQYRHFSAKYIQYGLVVPQ